MARHRRYLCLFYALVATVALITTWSQNFVYLVGMDGPGESVATLSRFLADTRVNAAARSMTADLALVGLAAMTFMIIEARRLGIRFVWAYVAFGFLVAISVTLPLFLIARERHLAWQEGSTEGAGLLIADGIGIAAVSATVATLGGVILG